MVHVLLNIVIGLCNAASGGKLCCSKGLDSSAFSLKYILTMIWVFKTINNHDPFSEIMFTITHPGPLHCFQSFKDFFKENNVVILISQNKHSII